MKYLSGTYNYDPKDFTPKQAAMLWDMIHYQCPVLANAIEVVTEWDLMPYLHIPASAEDPECLKGIAKFLDLWSARFKEYADSCEIQGPKKAKKRTKTEDNFLAALSEGEDDDDG